MPLSRKIKIFFSVMLGLFVVVCSSPAVGSPPAQVFDATQVELLGDMNDLHTEQKEILSQINQGLQRIGSTLGGTGGGSYDDAGGIGGASTADFNLPSKSLNASSNDVDALYEEIRGTFMRPRNEEGKFIFEENEAYEKRIKSKREYVSDVIALSLASAINIRDNFSETDIVIGELMLLDAESTSSVIDDLKLNNRILRELLKYVATLGISTALYSETLAADILYREDSL